MEKYLTVVKIRKHRVALSKLRLSDHNLHIHSGRQTRPITPRALRHCISCTDKIEDEPHLMSLLIDLPDYWVVGLLGCRPTLFL